MCSPLIYCFWLPFWSLYCVFSFDLLLLITFLVIILCVLLWSTASHYLFGYYIMCSPLIYCFSLSFWLLYCVFSFNLMLLIVFLVIILCVLLWSTASHCLFGHYIVCSPLIYCFSLSFWSLYCVFSFDLLLLITFLVIILCVLLWSTASHYLFGYYIMCSPLIYCFSLSFWLLYCVFSFNLLLLIVFLVIILCVLL